MASYIWPPSGSGGGSGVLDLNGLTGSISLIAGAGITITPGAGTLTIDATGASPVGAPNTFAGYDNAGDLFAIPSWGISTAFTPSRFGVNASFQIDPFLTAGYSVINNISSQLIPTADAPNDSEVLLQLNTQIDPTNTGFGIGAPTGLAARILDLNLSAPTSGANGQIQAFNIEADIGDPVITGGSANSLIPVNIFVHQRQGFSVAGLNGVSTALQLDIGSSVDRVDIYSANLQLNGSLSDFVSYYQAFGNITNTNVSTANIRMFDTSVQINGHLGDVSIFTDFNTILASANITAEYNSVDLSPSSTAGGVIRSYTGINIDPNFSATPITDDIIGMRISIQNITAGTNLTGLDINVNGSTDSNPQGVIGISSNGRVQIGATTTLVSGQGFQIGNRIESLFHIPSGSPVTGTDSLGNDFAGDLSAEDNLALGPIGLGWTSVGFVADMSVAVGKTVDTVNVFLPAVALPDPGYTTGGHVNDLSFIRMFTPLSQGGTITVDNLYSVKLDPIFGNLTSIATNAWGIWIGDTTADNWFAKNVVIGGSTGQPEAGQALDVTGPVRFRDLTAGVVTSDANGHLSVSGGTFALQDLSNLTSPTAINQTLTFDPAVPGVIATPDVVSTGNSESLTMQTGVSGNALHNHSGGIVRATGNSLGTGIGANSGSFTDTTGDAVQSSGSFSWTTGNPTNLNSGAFIFTTGPGGTAGVSGGFVVNLGPNQTDGGGGNDFAVSTGASTGNAPSANTTFTIGASSGGGDTGNFVVTIPAATGGGNQGNVELSAAALQVTGHLTSLQATAPTVAVQANAGTGATASIDAAATDSKGIVTVTTGTLSISTGSYCVVTFNTPYATAPTVVLSANNAAAGLIAPYWTSTTTTLTINFAVAGGISTALKVSYHCIE